ncbi:methyltransferase [Rossellomorea marisflavi]|uniref:Methyltransferase n=1 Tax=Rossellomorea marisflavi TaxID=189381 RepID=A0A0M0G4H1_9BACI|nr:O-methyltransferase [Rossellomorea marisflavi]KON84668.1 methyltransferase [Rossellomorea marisflavi]
MGSELWNEVDQYFARKLLMDDELERVLGANREAGLPEIDVSPLQGKFLTLMAQMKGAKRVLEIGTLGGYSTICLAKGVGVDGRVTTLEVDQAHALIAEGNIRRAGFLEQVEVLVGSALDTLPKLKEAGHVFDLVFIDADKENNPRYLEWALALTTSGSVIVADNVVRNGEVVDAASTDERVIGIREYMDLAQRDPRIDSTAIQTVGSKGYDGLVISVVK